MFAELFGIMAYRFTTVILCMYQYYSFSIIQSTNLLGQISVLSWNSTGKIGRIGRHRAEKPNVEVTVGLGPMPPDASDFPGGIPALDASDCTHSFT